MKTGNRTQGKLSIEKPQRHQNKNKESNMTEPSKSPINIAFSKIYGAPKSINSPNDAKSELGRIKAFIRNNNNGITAIAEFFASRCRFIAEKYPNLRLSVIEILQALVETRPDGVFLRNTNTKFRQNYTAKDWEQESLERYEYLKPISFKTNKPSIKKNKTTESSKSSSSKELKCDIDIILVGGNSSKKDALEQEVGYVIKHIPVERNAKSCSKIEALWNGTHMKDFGIIVCLCKHLAHRATNMLDTCFKQRTNWVLLKKHNDNCKIIAESIKKAIQERKV